MKKIVYLMFVCLSFACADNQLESVDETLQPVKMFTTKAEMPEVYVENGYLVLKDLEALDGLEASLAEMSEEALLAWEKQLGFESARTFFMPYFDEFDALEDEQDAVEFQERHKNVLRIVDEAGVCDVDYPFETYGRAGVLSKEGKIKIGKTLWIYKADRKITINDMTESKVAEFGDARISSVEKGVIVEYYKPIQTRIGQASGYRTLTGGDQHKDDRRYKWALDVYPESADGKARTVLALYQQGYKRKNSKKDWRTYRVTYECQLYKFALGYDNLVNSVKVRTSSKGRGGQYFRIAEINATDFMSFKIGISHWSSGYRLAPAIDDEFYGTGRGDWSWNLTYSGT